jgi:hypothetical protein
MRQARGFLLVGIACTVALGCAPLASRSGPYDNLPLPAAGPSVLSAVPTAAAAIAPIHVTAIGEASEASERIGIRGMFGIMQRSSGGPLGAVDPTSPGNPYQTDADYPVIVTDINYTDELDENFSIEVSFGSIVIGDGFRVPMPAGGDPDRYELKAANHFWVFGGTALFRIGSGRLGRFYGGPGVNLFMNNFPGKEEQFRFSGMLTWKAPSGTNFSFSVDAKYWLIGFGNQQYALLGANFAWRF